MNRAWHLAVVIGSDSMIVIPNVMIFLHPQVKLETLENCWHLLKLKSLLHVLWVCRVGHVLVFVSALVQKGELLLSQWQYIHIHLAWAHFSMCGRIFSFGEQCDVPILRHFNFKRDKKSLLVFFFVFLNSSHFLQVYRTYTAIQDVKLSSSIPTSGEMHSHLEHNCSFSPIGNSSKAKARSSSRMVSSGGMVRHLSNWCPGFESQVSGC